jgi:hypothetical protein
LFVVVVCGCGISKNENCLKEMKQNFSHKKMSFFGFVDETRTQMKKTSAVDGNQVVSDLTIRIVTGSLG